MCMRTQSLCISLSLSLSLSLSRARAHPPTHTHYISLLLSGTGFCVVLVYRVKGAGRLTYCCVGPRGRKEERHHREDEGNEWGAFPCLLDDADLALQQRDNAGCQVVQQQVPLGYTPRLQRPNGCDQLHRERHCKHHPCVHLRPGQHTQFMNHSAVVLPCKPLALYLESCLRTQA